MNNTIQDLLNVEAAGRGDAFFTPAGRIHAIGAGVVLAEIQQTSDITYRIYDWGRTPKKGPIRELHTELALDAIDFSAYGKSKIRKDLRDNNLENLVKCEFFDINIIQLDDLFERDYNLIDSFIIYICTEGSFLIRWEKNSEAVSKGETILLPAMIRDIILEPQPHARLLEIYIGN
jgi:mannose-6-phosphate isomerase